MHTYKLHWEDFGTDGQTLKHQNVYGNRCLTKSD